MVTKANPLDTFQPLTKYESDYERPDNLACISAGYKDAQGVPKRSTDGTIYISDPEGRAPGLARILESNGRKRLTIAMPSNDPADFIHQSYRKEGRSRLEAFGDEASITTIAEDGTRTEYKAGTKEYERLVGECKVSTSITFILAEYDKQGRPLYPFPDGLGTYRLRTTSANTVGNLMACLKGIARFTGGSVAGFPLEVSLVYRNVSDPKGAKRNVPVFVFTLRPPATITLDSRTFGAIASAAKEAIGMCMPALPAPVGIEDAIAEYEELPPAALNALTTGLDAAKVRATFFAILGDDESARRKFLSTYTNGATDSLSTFLETATPESADAMLEVLRVQVEGQVVHEVEAELVTDDPPVMATREQAEQLWGVIESGYSDSAREVLAQCLDAYKVTRIGEMTAAQVQQAIAHYRAHAPKKAA